MPKRVYGLTQDYKIRLSGASVRFIQVGSQSDRSWNVPCGSAGLGRNLLRKVRTRPEGSEGSCSWVRVCTWPLHMAGRYRRGPELIGPFRTRPCIWPEHMAQSITGRYRGVYMDHANGLKVPKRAHGSCTWSEGAEKLVHVHASTDPG